MRTITEEKPFEIYSLSEKAVTLEFGNSIDESILNRISAFNYFLQQNPFQGMVATVPAYTSLSIFFDPVIVIHSNLPGVDAFDKVTTYLLQIANQTTTTKIDGSLIHIPVYYGSELGPDLEYVAQYTNLSTDEVISLHTSTLYIVYMIGFIPGFAYLGGLPNELSAPRKSDPRPAVPAGSVGIAGKQTGIYPVETPGGWQLIGQTPLKLFDIEREAPSLLKAGDTVQFHAISYSEFEELKANYAVTNS